MKIYVSKEVMQLFQIEVEKFGMQKIGLMPVWMEEDEHNVWAIYDAQNSDEAIVEMKSETMRLWVPQSCIEELKDRVIVRGRRGFTTVGIGDSLPSQVTTFVTE